jgi:hypothetical protein
MQRYMAEEQNSHVQLTVSVDNQPNNFSSSDMSMWVSGEKRNDMPIEKFFKTKNYFYSNQKVQQFPFSVFLIKLNHYYTLSTLDERN